MNASVAAVPWLSAGRHINVEQSDQWYQQAGLAFQFQLERREFYAGEMIAIDYQIKSNDAFISLTAENNGEQREQYTVLATRKENLKTDDKWLYLYRLTILYRAGTAGKQPLHVPALIYSEGGRDQYRIEFAPQAINVMSLPVYLPPDMLLAPVTIKSSVSPASGWLQPLTTDYLYYWVIDISGNNLGPRLHSDVMRAVTTSEYFEFMPAEIVEVTRKQNRSINQHVQYRIPFTVKTSGRSSLPAIQMQYYDTRAGKIVATSSAGIKIVAMNKTLQRVLIVFVMLLLLCMVILVSMIARRAWLAYRSLTTSLQQFKNAQTPEQERQAIHHFSDSLGWPAAMGLYQWDRYWQHQVGQNDQLHNAIESLSQCLYSRQKTAYDGQFTAAIQSVSFPSLYKLFINRYFVI